MTVCTATCAVVGIPSPTTSMLHVTSYTPSEEKKAGLDNTVNVMYRITNCNIKSTYFHFDGETEKFQCTQLLGRKNVWVPSHHICVIFHAVLIELIRF